MTSSTASEPAYLRVLLQTMSNGFRSDAEGGGGFAGADEARRYSAIVTLLGGVLKAGGGGTQVVECIVAAASAIGQEKHWKSMTHFLVDAVGGDDRDIKTRGLDVLNGLLDALGEEYIVLLPEFLTCLSECLEDSKEIEVMKKAKRVIEEASKLSGEDFSKYLNG